MLGGILTATQATTFPYNGSWKIPTTDRRATWNVLDDGKPGEYLTDRLTDEAIQFIHQSKQDRKPFSLYFPHYGVHQSRRRLK